jgi:hypothetical protein
MTTKRETKAARIARLETELARERRDFQAMAEWFVCESNGHATTELEVAIDGRPALRVIVHGIFRASGGVCVVSYCSDSTWRDFPRYLDDLCSDWAIDCVPEIRDAARILRQRRDEYCRPEPVSAHELAEALTQ